MTEPLRLRVNEIYHSVQGEGTHAGLRCVFIRLTGCNLACAWCDTQYALHEGDWMVVEEVLAQVSEYRCPLVAVTGGEPLLQPAVYPSLSLLADVFETVLVETSGAISIEKIDPRVIRIMDIKCPGSGQVERNCWSNIELLRPNDEVKFVILSRSDYDWARQTIERHDLLSRCPILLSPVFGKLEASELAGWIMEDHLNVRLGVQLHKLIWPPNMRGV